MRTGPPVAQQRHQVAWSESLLLHPKAKCRDRVGLINREFLLLVIVNEKREEFQFDSSCGVLGAASISFSILASAASYAAFVLILIPPNCREGEMFPFRELRCRNRKYQCVTWADMGRWRFLRLRAAAGDFRCCRVFRLTEERETPMFHM